MKIDVKNTLWQSMAQCHLDSENKLTQAQWNEFIYSYGEVYASLSSDLAYELFDQFMMDQPQIAEVLK